MESPDLEGLGRLVRERRLSLGLTQTQLGERIGWVQERISLVENGRYGTPSLPALVRLARALQISLSPLFEAVGYGDSLPVQLESEAPVSNVVLQCTLQRLLAIQATTLKETLDEASDFMARALGADKVDAFVYDPTSDSLVALGTSNTPVGRRQHQLGLHRIPCANGSREVQVYRTGTPYYTGRADEDPEMTSGAVQALGIRSLFAVPIHLESTIHGVMMVSSTLPDQFSPEERQFFEAATHWVAMVARRAELNEAMTRTAAEDARRIAAEELVTLLAHDLGNALGPIKGRLQMMLRRATRDKREQDVRDTTEMSHSVDRLQRMVSELLDVARLDHGIFSLSRDMIDLTALVDATVRDVRSIRSDITVHMPEKLCAYADSGRVFQVLGNLVSNAVHHVPEQAPITITGEIETRQDGQWAVIRVHDGGPGIPQDVMPRLFARFASGPRSSGLGLGLYLARSIAEAHGGQLTVDSAPGQGTTFTLSLPMVAPQ